MERNALQVKRKIFSFVSFGGWRSDFAMVVLLVSLSVCCTNAHSSDNYDYVTTFIGTGGQGYG
jgi:hypothetical protein